MKRQMRHLVLMLAVPFAALAASSVVVSATTLKLGHGSSESSPTQKSSEIFAAKLKELTKGALSVDIYCCSQTGNDTAQAKSVQLGAQDIALVGTNNMVQLDPRLDIFSLPGLFNDNRAARKAVNGPVAAKIFEDFRARTGLRVLWIVPIGARSITNSKRPVREPKDMKGLLIRSPGSPVMNDTYKALGALPTPISFAELFSALQQGVADGADMSPCDVMHLKYFEVQKYQTTTNLFVVLVPAVINDKKFNSLSESERRAVQEAARAADDYGWSVIDQCEQQGIENSKKAGLTVIELTDAERKKFHDLVRPVWSKYADRVGGLELIKQLFDSSR